MKILFKLSYSKKDTYLFGYLNYITYIKKIFILIAFFLFLYLCKNELLKK